MGIPLSEEQETQLRFHAEQLMQWNRKMNLTAITEPADVAEKHFLDCLGFWKLGCIRKGDVVLDMGAGGGFPGIVLKIMDPSLTVLMVDASRKKVNFLKHVVRGLKLTDIDLLHERIETLHKDRFYLEAFDVVTSRAFSDISSFITLSMPFLKSTGMILAMKGQQNRLDSDTVDRRFNQETLAYTLPFEGATRHVMAFSIKP